MPDTIRSRWLDREDVSEYSSFEELAAGWPETSRFISVKIPSAQPVDLRWDYRNSQTTIVMFHAALDQRVTELPVFQGRQISAATEANRLYISDPAHYCSDRILTGWFMGTRQLPYLQNDLLRVFSFVNSNFARDRLIMFGPSAGGFASLFYASYFPNSLAIAVNPQTNIEGHSAVAISNLCEDAWLVHPTVYAPLRKIPAAHEVISIYSRPTTNYVLYVQNLEDAVHIREQYTPFRSNLHPSNAVHELTGKWGAGHVPPPSSLMKALLEEASRGTSLEGILESVRGDQYK